MADYAEHVLMPLLFIECALIKSDLEFVFIFYCSYYSYFQLIITISINLFV